MTASLHGRNGPPDAEGSFTKAIRRCGRKVLVARLGRMFHRQGAGKEARYGRSDGPQALSLMRSDFLPKPGRAGASRQRHCRIRCRSGSCPKVGTIRNRYRGNPKRRRNREAHRRRLRQRPRTGPGGGDLAPAPRKLKPRGSSGEAFESRDAKRRQLRGMAQTGRGSGNQAGFRRKASRRKLLMAPGKGSFFLKATSKGGIPNGDEVRGNLLQARPNSGWRRLRQVFGNRVLRRGDPADNPNRIGRRKLRKT